MLAKVIDPAPIIKELADRCLVAKGVECQTLGKVIDMIRAAPTVDAVEVVLCEECTHCGVVKHSGNLYCRKPMGCIGCTPTKPDGFCSYGERKDNGTV